MNAVLSAVVLGAALAAALPADTSGVGSGQRHPRDRRDTGIYIGPGSFSANVNVNNTGSRLPLAAGPATAAQHSRDRQEHQPAGTKVSEVYGLHIGEGNFSPTVNGQGLGSPSALLPQVAVNLSSADAPAIAKESETPSASQSQPDLEKNQPADSSGPVVYGVNIGDGNFSPNINVPSIGSPSVNVARITSHAASEPFIKVPNFG